MDYTDPDTDAGYDWRESLAEEAAARQIEEDQRQVATDDSGKK